ncbi:MAG TPA: hypothetical protein VM261_10100 [Kofleriaceae bacterium]|nr:hypothetical protein [Kofleriaceae bacterium]
MKRILIVALMALSAHAAWAQDAPPTEIGLSGNAGADMVIATVNQTGRAMWQMEQEQNILLKAKLYQEQLAKAEEGLQQDKQKFKELDKQLAQQERDLKANYETARAGRSDADREKLKAEYDKRKKELADARKLAAALPGTFGKIGSHIGAQADLLNGLKKKEDWVDENGVGRGRALFHKRRKTMDDLITQAAKSTAKIKATIDKGSELDFKGEKTGKFEVKIANVQDSKPEWEWTVNGKTWKKNDKLYVGDDRTIKIQVKLVEDRRKQSRTIKGSATTQVTVNQKDYDFEYGNDRGSSHWSIAEETYSDWRVEAKSPRDPGVTESSSGVYGTVKGDVMTIVFSPDTATEQLHVSVIGRLEWKLEGKRNGSPVLDKAEASGNWSIDLSIAPAK